MGNTQTQRPNTNNTNHVNDTAATRIPVNLFDHPQNPEGAENQPLQMISNDYILHKDTFHLKHSENNDENAYFLTFNYSSKTNVYITVYFEVTLEKELLTGKIKSFSCDSGFPKPKQYKCPAGVNQKFPENIIKVEPALFRNIERMISYSDTKYPLIITMEPAIDNPNTAIRNTYMYTFIGNEKKELVRVQLIKQKLEIGEETYEIDDIYISSADNSENQTLNSGPVTCIVCYSNSAKILLYPCRHFCLCESCAKKVKDELKMCPVCRKSYYID